MMAGQSRTAEIRALARHDEASALALLSGLLEDLFGLEASNLAINHDQYSLNSLNGFFDTRDGAFFFKFHQEEGEEDMRGEYYRAEILEKAGLPVDMPVHLSVQPGEQILIYRRRSDLRFSDVLRKLDLAPDEDAEARARAAEAGLNRQLLSVSRRTLHPVTPDEVAREPIHRLFHERLIDPRTGAFPGGRYRNFYVGQRFAFPGAVLDWAEFSAARFVINGTPYRSSIGELFEAAAESLHPSKLAASGGIVAHGDAHNANVWYEERHSSPRLVFFDPAFAGHHVPSLLAEIKSTFHNILAHPFWLYDPDLAARHFSAHASHADGQLEIRTDWQPSRVRRDLLAVKAEEFWRPWLKELKDRSMLQPDWRRTMRLALFLCPTLVMNLRAGAGGHNETSSLIGFAMSMMAGSEPETGHDMICDFLDGIDPG
jgi:hypothetical protein